MKSDENEENNTTKHVNHPPPLLPTTVELSTLCTQYVFSKHISYRSGKKAFNSYKVLKQSKKSDTFFVS